MSSCVSCSLWQSLFAAIQSVGRPSGSEHHREKRKPKERGQEQEKEIVNAADSMIMWLNKNEGGNKKQRDRVRGESCISRKMSTRPFFFSSHFFLGTPSSSGSLPHKVRIIREEMQKLWVNLRRVSAGTHGTAAKGGAHCCCTFTVQMFLVMHQQSHFHTRLMSFIHLYPRPTLLNERSEGRCPLTCCHMWGCTPSGQTRHCWKITEASRSRQTVFKEPRSVALHLKSVVDCRWTRVTVKVLIQPGHLNLSSSTEAMKKPPGWEVRCLQVTRTIPVALNWTQCSHVNNCCWFSFWFDLLNSNENYFPSYYHQKVSRTV